MKTIYLLPLQYDIQFYSNTYIAPMYPETADNLGFV